MLSEFFQMKQTMKTYILIFLVLILSTCKQDKNCKGKRPDWCPLYDPSETYYNPVCGCDGKTYFTKESAQCQGLLSWSDGVCSGNESITYLGFSFEGNILNGKNYTSKGIVDIKIVPDPKFWYGLNAVVSNRKTLKMIIKNKSTKLPNPNLKDSNGNPIPLNKQNGWYFIATEAQGWVPTTQNGYYDYAFHQSSFSTMGPTYNVQLISFYKDYLGTEAKADIELYEDEATTPTKIISINW
jgi:hypothetical protein